MAVGALTRVGRENPLHSLRWSRCSEGASQRNFDADQIRRFAKMLSGQVGRGSSVVLRPTASQDRCQRRMQGLEELRSNGPLPCARARLTQEVWAFAHTSDYHQISA
jgi:hypothetical protein